MIAPGDLSLDDGEVLEILGRGELDVLGLLPGSSNLTFLARVRDGRDELLAVYKPRRGETPLWDFPDGTLHRREVAAYDLARSLGWPRVPPTLRRDGPHGIGSVQRFLPFEPSQHYFTLQDDPRFEEVFRRVALFDVVANNADRKAGHCLLAEDGSLFVVDHGVCFSDEPKLRTVIWAFAGDPLPERERDELATIADRFDVDVRPRLEPHLAREEIDATAGRLTELLSSGRFPEPGPGRPYPWPPV